VLNRSIYQACSQRVPKHIVLYHIGHASRPGFICIATNVDTVNERHFLGHDIGHIDVDVENQIRDLLNDNPCDEIAAELLALADLAATALADRWTCPDLCLDFSWHWNELVLA
jgi:hypothetical protein